ncbi:uncharacterized protein LOC103517368 [Diaphorina citri]|uniref:Uncharacterized protein LOC103517368 n=1 Tax=Diaphorina citri TaxID=121845 RepID=A0A1S3DGN5_DIACI|nr:uncharacterized protein LOC103517368 [Diaphorina citri]KAI5700704.1 hypothetical protein M8J75_002151 [Diaphorina citri]KAI5730387.1 hypothetical protein M8J76_013102 [Diaphorina citri]KAI5734498.1 hypothetical protein M8J77_007180 [Diaphorina citri]
METQTNRQEDLVRKYQRLERNLILKDGPDHVDISPVACRRSNSSLVHTIHSSFQHFQTQLQTVYIDYDIVREIYDFSHLLMRIFFISNRMISILFNAVTLFIITARAIFHISKFILLNSARMCRLDFKQASVLTDLGLFSLELLVLTVLMVKIFVPTCLYMTSFILNVIFYYVPRSLSILLSLW